MRLTGLVAAVTVTAALSIAGGVAVPGVHAASGTVAKASQTCTANKNAVFGSSVNVSHGGCVAAITSQGRSSALYTSMCRSLMKNNGGTLNGVAPSTTSGFLSTTTATTISKILAAVAMPSSGKFSSVGQCMAAINKAKTATLANSRRSGTTGGTSGTTGGKSGTKHGKSGTTHGQSGTTHGKSDTNHGKLGTTQGQSGTSDDQSGTTDDSGTTASGEDD